MVLHLPQSQRKIKALFIYHNNSCIKILFKDERSHIISTLSWRNLWTHSIHLAGFQIWNHLKHRNNLSTKGIWKVGECSELKSQKGERPDVLPTGVIWSNVSDTWGQRAPRQMPPFTAGRSVWRALWKAGGKGCDLKVKPCTSCSCSKHRDLCCSWLTSPDLHLLWGW